MQEGSARLSTGIPGLDEVLHGGLPRNSVVLIQGEPGCGKTTFALQVLLEGIRRGDTCLLVSNAETPDQLRSIAESHGWSLEGIHIAEWHEPAASPEDDTEGYTLFPEAEIEVGATLQHLFASVERVRPGLLVLDSISALRVLAPTPAFYRRQLRRVRDFLNERSCTTLLLDDASPGDKDARSRTLADGVFELRQIDFSYGGDRRRLRVRKLRGSTYLSGAHDVSLVTGGLQVFPRLVAHDHSAVAAEKALTSGLPELDALTRGGLPRGTSTLVIGPAGIGKSTIAMVYAMAAADVGEQCCVLLFDESLRTYTERARGLGFALDGAMDQGLVAIEHLDPAELSVGQISHFVLRQVEQRAVRLLVIDTLNGYLQSASEEENVLLHLRELISYLNRRGIVTLLTLTQHGILGGEMSTPIDISFIADNVLLLRYFESHGTIRKALSMVKKRTGEHERTIRELVLSPGGITVSGPLEDFTGVLSGTPGYIGPGLPERT